MKFNAFINLLRRNWMWLLFIPIIVAGLIYFLTGQKEKQYTSSMQLYTGFASGYNVESGSGSKIDFFAVNNSLDNLINTIESKAVLTQVSLKLFAGSLIEGKVGNDKFISHKSYLELLKIVPVDVVKLVDYKSIDSTVVAMEKYMNRNTSNFVYELVNLYHPEYSLWALQKIKIEKVGQSDLLDISYSCSDPGLCYQTLLILSGEFIDSYSNLSIGQTDDVVKYFERELAKSLAKLTQSEDQYMEYSKAHKVINYYEQTKSIAGQLEAFELDYDQVLSRNAIAGRSAQMLESKMGMNARLRLKSQSVLDARRKVAKESAMATTQNLFLDDSSYMRFNTNSLSEQIRKGEAAIHATLDTMDFYKNTPEGIEIDNVLNSWLENIVVFDATKAALSVLDGRRKLIEDKFEFYAPVGATVKRGEREINVNEQEYLSLLHSLALAKLRVQEIAMSSSSLRIVDEPQFPINSEPGKRKILTIGGFVASFMLVLMVLVIVELTDRTLRDAIRATRLTGLRVIGLVPVRTKRSSAMRHLAMNHLMVQIMRLRHGGIPLTLNILTVNKNYDPINFAELLNNNISEMGYSVKILASGHDFEQRCKQYIEAQCVEDLLDIGQESKDVLIAILPEVCGGIVPTSILINSSINILVCPSGKVWKESDETAIQFLVEQQSVSPIYLVLDGVDGLALEHFMGKSEKS